MGKKLSQIEKEYGVDFGVKNDIQLATYLRRQGFPSLAKCLTRLDSMKTKPSPRTKMKPVKAWALFTKNGTFLRAYASRIVAADHAKCYLHAPVIVPVLIIEAPKSRKR